MSMVVALLPVQFCLHVMFMYKHHFLKKIFWWSFWTMYVCTPENQQ